MTVCQYVSTHGGPTVHPSSTEGVFATGSIACLAHVLLAGISQVRLHIAIEAYGMKGPVQYFSDLAEIQQDVPGFQCRVDLGITYECNGIPLFTSSTGKVFPMFYRCGGGNGSISLTTRGFNCTRTVVYPTLMHHVKSLYHGGHTIPKINGSIQKREARLARTIEDLRTKDVTGFRVEVQKYGTVSLRSILRRLPVSQLSLPSSVSCNYVMDADLYFDMVESYFQHVKDEGLFRGNPSTRPSPSKIQLLGRMINMLGVFTWQFSKTLRSGSVSQMPSLCQKIAQTVTVQIEPESELREIGDDTDTLVEDIMTDLHFRCHPRNRSKVCATKKATGGVTQTFDTRELLARHIAATFGTSWRDYFLSIEQ